MPQKISNHIRLLPSISSLLWTIVYTTARKRDKIKTRSSVKPTRLLVLSSFLSSSLLVVRFALPDNVSFVQSEQQKFCTNSVCEHTKTSNFTRRNRYEMNSRYNSSNWSVFGSTGACKENWFCWSISYQVAKENRLLVCFHSFSFFFSFFKHTEQYAEIATENDQVIRRLLENTLNG